MTGRYSRLFGVMGLIVAAMLVLAACEVNIDAGSDQQQVADPTGEVADPTPEPEPTPMPTPEPELTPTPEPTPTTVVEPISMEFTPEDLAFISTYRFWAESLDASVEVYVDLMENLLAGESIQVDDIRHELGIWEWVYQGLLEENPTPRFVDAYALFLLGADHLNGAAAQLRLWLETSEQDVFLEGVGLADEGMALLDEAHGLFNEIAAGAPVESDTLTAEEQQYVSLFLDIAYDVDDVMLWFLELLDDNDLDDEVWFSELELIVDEWYWLHMELLDIDPPLRFEDSYYLFLDGVAWLDWGGEDLLEAIQTGDEQDIDQAVESIGYGADMINLAHERFDQEIGQQAEMTSSELLYAEEYIELSHRIADSMYDLIDNIHSDTLTYTQKLLNLQPVFVGWEGVEDSLSRMDPPARFREAHERLVEGVTNLRAAGQDLHQAVAAGSDALVDAALDRIDLAIDLINAAHEVFDAANEE